MAIDFDIIRADVAGALYTTPEEIGMEDNLADMGLDSMLIMTLVMGWQERGMDMDFLSFAEEPTLRAWQAALEAHQD
ncbi:phosphopantetheine-binding protein [Celeribacter indicus]|uniref:Phosphopantetheine-binding protein n=1 Tax=Celeribacter indicus TaxID=1208324 RepID=A0A0B5DTR8_9RHOB|nr:phosphopantetheine-binding protein [Celeribacter indicus]AJE46823.1 phosphopantetheine-binding protein [Celeribacter indicus]SDW81027.1 Aryl carrier domain-containing protein [Celeribacter indicus]